MKLPEERNWIHKACGHPPDRRAFSRVDALVGIAVVVMVGVWFTINRRGENGRIAHCGYNLKKLGEGLQSYANDHNDAIPAAGISWEKTKTSWDENLYSYLKPKQDVTLSDLAPAFTCPSDTEPHKGTPRSYAMGGNDMLPKHWPPGSNSPTGIGLVWDKETVPALLEKDFVQKSGFLPVIKRSDVPAPAETLLLTEFINPYNNLRYVGQTTVFGPSQQVKSLTDGGYRFHHGKFNYLMVDGHVELLSPLQTGSLDGSAGIWSLKKD